MVDALRRSSAASNHRCYSLLWVTPRQDRRVRSARVPITAKVDCRTC